LQISFEQTPLPLQNKPPLKQGGFTGGGDGVGVATEQSTPVTVLQDP